MAVCSTPLAVGGRPLAAGGPPADDEPRCPTAERGLGSRRRRSRRAFARAAEGRTYHSPEVGTQHRRISRRRRSGPSRATSEPARSTTQPASQPRSPRKSPPSPLAPSPAAPPASAPTAPLADTPLTDTPLTESDRRVVAAALAEDAAGSDVTSLALVPPAALGAAEIRAKGAGVVAGLAVVVEVFRQVDPRVRVELRVRDGDRVAPGTVAVRLDGPLVALLAGERTAVNFLQRMSGIATTTARFVEAVRGTGARVLATRKTAPGLRAFDLAAVRAGGGGVHRESLAAQVLVKENHLRAARAAGTATSMAEVVARVAAASACAPGARAARTRVGIEAADLDEFAAALAAGVDVVLLDNFTPAQCARAVRLRAKLFPRGGAPELEASGGIALANVAAYARTGVERVSVGALTHSAPALDLSMTVLG